jgi:sigma-B regulation protein RsbU (phosphoserine phosphatase)
MYGDYNENFSLMKLAMSTGQPVRELAITVSEYGYLASACVPILGKDSIPFAYVGVDISMDYILGFLIRYLTVIALATAVIMVLCFTALFFLVRGSVVNPIKMIAEKTGEFTQKVTDVNFEELRIRSSDEIGDLSASVNTMFGEIRDFTARLATETAHRERVQSELDMAKAIQEGALPKIFPPFHDLPDVTIFASMAAAKEVGGDFYDFFVVGEGKLAVAIADVSGKGVPAALFMMEVKTLIKNQSFSDDEPCKLLETVNNRLCENNEAGMFVTLFIGMLDMKRNTLKYANAGHNPPVMLHNDRAFWLPVHSGIALGVMENMEFVTQETPFEEGDLLLLYTDGVTEAMNEEKELFGNDRLIELLSAKAKETVVPGELLETLREAIGSFAGDAEQADDITMLALLKTGK